MKQHILRLCIVLVLVVGVGFLVLFLVKDNSNFYVNDYTSSQMQTNAKTYEKIDEIKLNVNDEFVRNKIFYDSFEESLKFYNSFLINYNLDKSTRDSIKTEFKNFNDAYSNLSVSLNSLDSYLKEESPNAGELDGRKAKVNKDFVTLNNKFYDLTTLIENVVKNKIFDGKYLDASFSLTSCKNLLISKCLTSNYAEFAFVNSVISKVTALKQANYKVNDKSVIFAVKYNEISGNVSDILQKYFESGEKDDINFFNLLESEAYYETI